MGKPFVFFWTNEYNCIIYSSLSAFLVLSIISAVICLPLITFAAMALSQESWYLHKNVCEDLPIYYDPKHISRCSYYYESNCCISQVGNIWSFSPLVLSKWEIPQLSQFVYFMRKVCLFLNFWMIKCTISSNKT